MIAMQRQMAIHDFLLLALAVVVIVLNCWPTPANRQMIDVRGPQGEIQRYSLAVDDPRLQELEQQLYRRSQSRPLPGLTWARWQAEVAEFYAQRTRSNAETGKVVAVSFTDQQVKVDRETEYQRSLNRQHGHWLAVHDQSLQAIAKYETLMESQRAMLGPPPMAFAEVSSGGPAHHAFWISALAGLLVACCFAGWTYVCPARSLAAQSGEPELTSRSKPLKRQSIEMSIPTRWVRVHQPLAVWLRRTVYGSLVAAALLCIIA
ncbi:MAG: hypothetical protein AB8B91_21770 [Rubripirellula sp.]